MGSLSKDVFEVPAALGVADDVDAGGGALGVDDEADGGELDVTTPERADADSGFDLVGADDGLVAEGGVFADDEVFEGEAGHGKEVDGDAVEMDGAAQALAHVGGDAEAEAADVDERGGEGEGQQDEQGDGDLHGPTPKDGRCRQGLLVRGHLQDSSGSKG